MKEVDVGGEAPLCPKAQVQKSESQCQHLEYSLETLAQRPPFWISSKLRAAKWKEVN